MNPKNTWGWILVAAILAGLIVLSERLNRKIVVGPQLVLTDFKAGTVTGIQVTPAGKRDFRAERTNAVWQLVKPISSSSPATGTYPAQAAGISGLLTALEGLTVALRISGAEMHQGANRDAEFGFAAPQFRLTVQSRDKAWPITVGARTAIGDQVYLQIVGMEGAYVVDADWLKLVPREANDWRDLAFVDLTTVQFDHVGISNGASAFELQHVPASRLWVLGGTDPARADSEHFLTLLRRLHGLRVAHFITDEAAPDLQPYGLQPPELQIVLAVGTNRPVRLEFGKSVSTNAALVYARRSDQAGVVAVPREPLANWYEPRAKFRDHRLITFTQPVDEIEFRGTNAFTLRRQADGGWKVAGNDMAVDNLLVNKFVQAVGNLQIVEFKDAITDADLPKFGLAAPLRQLIFRSTPTNAPGATNLVLADVQFGGAGGNLFARRADENPVYELKLADFQQLPATEWQFRERRLWNFTAQDVTRLIIRQNGKTRQMVHLGTNQWMITEGSKVVINDLEIEGSTSEFGTLAANWWVERGSPDLSRYNMATNGISLQFVLKNGQTNEIRASALTVNADQPFGAVKLGDETWVFEMPPYLYIPLYRLQIPADVP